jgi:hypothetical protein
VNGRLYCGPCADNPTNAVGAPRTTHTTAATSAPCTYCASLQAQIRDLQAKNSALHDKTRKLEIEVDRLVALNPAKHYGLPSSTTADLTNWASRRRLTQGTEATIVEARERVAAIFKAGVASGGGVKFIAQGSTERNVAVRGSEVDLDFFAEWPKDYYGSHISDNALESWLKEHFTFPEGFYRFTAADDRVIFVGLLLKRSSPQHPVDIGFTRSATDFEKQHQFVESLKSTDPRVHLLTVALKSWAKAVADGKFKIPAYVLEFIAAREISITNPPTEQVTPMMMVSCLQRLSSRDFLRTAPNVDFTRSPWVTACRAAARHCILYFGGRLVTDRISN